MNRKMLWLILVFVLAAILVFNWGLQAPTVAAVKGAGEDLYIRDTPSDTGTAEPNPDTGPMFVSEDIWVRTTPDLDYQPYPFPEASPPWTPLPHENPEYRDPKFSVPNYVYVRVRNRGSMASSGTERLKLYWAKASTGLSWPAQWVDSLSGNCGSNKLSGAEITKPRKNAATATPGERAAYINAILSIDSNATNQFADGVSYFDKQDEVHNKAPLHHVPGFLPWHREFISRYEVLLQEADPTVTLLYWDWMTDPGDSSGFNFFTPSFMGNSGRSSATGARVGAPFASFDADSDCALARNGPKFPSVLSKDICTVKGEDWHLPPPVLHRHTAPGSPPVLASNDAILAESGFGNAFSSGMAFTLEQLAHDYAHDFFGQGDTVGANMEYLDWAAQDPIFFMLHANADRLWAMWQRNVRDPGMNKLGRLDPTGVYGDSSTDSTITNPLFPWNGDRGEKCKEGEGVDCIEPWTKKGGYIVPKKPTHASIVFPPIYDTAPLVIPVLNPGEAVVIQIPWYPPNPADFACIGGDKGHFCLLARIETDTAPPFGMTFPEGAEVSANTRNNNNIAWKNITVEEFSGALKLSSIFVRNVFGQPIQTGLRFANARDGASFFNFGEIFVDLKPELLRRWRAGGAVGQGIKVVGGGTVGDELLQITSPDAFIQNIRLEPGEVFSVDVSFALFKNYQLPQGVLPKWDLIQTGAPGNPNAILGGQRYDLDFRKIVPIPEGREWRYLDDGSNPGPSWPSPNFDDSKWRLGRAELGFGDDPATTIDGGLPDRRHITTFFRRVFEVADPSFFRSLLLRLKRDDGAVVYLNGTEIHRVNLPGGVVTPETLATREVRGLEEEVFFPIPVSLALLRQGRNVVAVEVHQNSTRSEDLSFDLELSANPVDTKFRPDVAFASPRNGALFQTGQAIPIEVEALDSDGQITSVSLFADGNPVGTDNQAPFTFQLSGASLGSHRLRAVATDNDLQQATVDLTITVLANTPPIVELTEPSDEAVFQVNEAIRLAAQASDPGGAVKQVEFHLRDADLFVAPDRLVGVVGAPPYALVLSGLAPGHYALTAITIDDRGAASQSTPVHFEVRGQGSTSPLKCDTIRFSSPQYWLFNLNRLLRGTVLIGRVNFNSPVSTSNVEAIKLALQGNALGFGALTPLQRLNRGFVAAQLSLARAGGAGSPVASNVLWANLGCPGLFGDFAPVTLSNGVVLTPNSMLKDLFMQAQSAIQQNRVVDFIVLGAFFNALNCDDPLGSRFPSVNCPPPFGLPLPDLTILQAFCNRLSPTEVRLTITVQNIGKAPAKFPVKVVALDGCGKVVGSGFTTYDLAPMGGLEVLFITLTCPSGCPVMIQVDPEGVVAEEFEVNNTKPVSCPGAGNAPVCP